MGMQPEDHRQGEPLDRQQLVVEPPPPSRDALERWGLPLVEAACREVGLCLTKAGPARLSAAHEALLDGLLAQERSGKDRQRWLVVLDVVDAARQLFDRGHPHDWPSVVTFGRAVVNAGLDDKLAVVLAATDWRRPEMAWGDVQLAAVPTVPSHSRDGG